MRPRAWIVALLLTALGCGFYGPPVRTYVPPPAQEAELEITGEEPDEEEEESPRP